MTSDKTPSELDAFIETHMPAYWQYGAVEQDRLRSLVLAASVKWGSPVVAGEVVAEMVPFHTPSGKRVAVISRFQHLPIGTKLYTTPQPTQAADSVQRDAALLHYALADGGNQSMNWTDIYEDWDGEGYFIDALRAAYRLDAARKQGGSHD